ncbi:juvenile hormone esterase-like [Periplaneta americana]|uniref:juvenile hormone esterase-like n=1 Tax=Periplaneta americana TaxID=6978 RepID=UPI0037E805A0
MYGQHLKRKKEACDTKSNLLQTAPSAPAKWEGVLNATKKTKLCIGASLRNCNEAEDEDCLYLNVYTPKLRPNSTETFSVLVFIPDDSFLGDESYLYGPDYLMDRGIIMVILNYRVGPLGFLSIGDTLVPGNYGLKDQVRALRWVRDNIAEFGGRPDSVTIHGHGSGGACVHYHMLSPMSRGLFHRAISQSGTALNPNMRPVDNPRLLAQKLANLTKCPSSDSVVMISCLKELNQSRFSNITSIPFGPTVEKANGPEEVFLSEDPLNIINEGKMTKVPWLMGSVNDEGASNAEELFQNETALFIWNDNSEDVLVTPTNLRLREEMKFMTPNWTKVLDFYMGNESHLINSNKYGAIIQLYGDRLYNLGIHLSAVLHALNGHTNIYKYNFELKAKSHYKKLSEDILQHVRAGHGDDLLYLFKLPMLEVFPPGQPELDYIEVLTSIIAGFVKTGDPVAWEKLSATWEPVGKLNRHDIHVKYMNISNGNESSYDNVKMTMSQDLFKDRMDLWLSFSLSENLAYFRKVRNFSPSTKTIGLSSVMYMVIPLVTALVIIS